MATLPPTLSFVTVTPTSVTVALVAPIDITFDHFLVFAYDYLTNTQVHASGSVAGPTYAVTGLAQGRAYIITAVAVDTGGENSLPSEELVVAETNAHNNVIGLPQILNAAGAQESLNKALIDFDLKDGRQIYGEMTVAEYSFNGIFTDAVVMKESYDDVRHEGRFDLEFDDPEVAHKFIWDLSEIPKNTVHTYKVRLRAKSGALYTLLNTFDVAVDKTSDENIPIPVVIEDGDLEVTIPVFRAQTAITGAVVTVTEIRDDTDTDLLGGAVVLPELGVTGVYQDTINLPVGTFPAGRYRMFYTVTATNLSIADSKVVLVVGEDYNVLTQLNIAELCLVYGRLVDSMNRPVVSQAVRVTHKLEGSRFDRVAADTILVYTDQYGFFAYHALRNTEILMEIPALAYKSLLKVPDQYTAQFNSIGFNQPSTLTRGPYGHVLIPELQ